MICGLSPRVDDVEHLARALVEREGTWTGDDGAALGERFDAELEPHFCTEDELLLPALRLAGAAALAARTADDHAFLRGQVELARAGDGDAARAFAARLAEHVRFEERELFPACEALVPDGVLDEVARRAPPHR